MHIEQSEGISGVFAHFDRMLQIAIHPMSAGIVVIAVGIVAVGIRVVHIVAEIKRCLFPATRCIFPLCLSWQAVSVSIEVPSDGGAANGIVRCQPLLLA